MPPSAVLEGSPQLPFRLSHTSTGTHPQETATSGRDQPAPLVESPPDSASLRRVHDVRSGWWAARGRPGPLRLATTMCPPGRPCPLDGLPSSSLPPDPQLARTQSRIVTSPSPAHRLRAGARRRQDVTRPGGCRFLPVSEQTRARPPGRHSACPHPTTVIGPRLTEHRPAGPVAPVRRFLVAPEAIPWADQVQGVMAAPWA